MPAKPIRITVLALTPLARDARVLRSAAALTAAGHRVVVIGRKPLPEGMPFRCVGLEVVRSAAAQRLELVMTQAPATLLALAAHALYWLPAARRELLGQGVESRPDLVVSNDWLTLPIGQALKDRLGATLVYDSHEYATKEHIHNWKWRLVSSAAVSAIEGRHIRMADLVLTVSRGIAEALRDHYALPDLPTVVRNVPPFQNTAFRPPGERRQVLFHGLIRPERGLEALIASVPSWEFLGDLVVRGYGSDTYVGLLKALADERGVSTRVRFEPPVVPEELIRLAATADIGYLALPDVTAHYEYALPNKLFEYLMAGLPVLATPRTEIRRVLDETGAGFFAELEPRALARALNAVSSEELVRMRYAALAAAKRFKWEIEAGALVDAVEKAHHRRRAGASSRSAS